MDTLHDCLFKTFPQKKKTVKIERMLGYMPICPNMDKVSKSVLYRSFRKYFEKNAKIFDKNKGWHICPSRDCYELNWLYNIGLNV